MLYHNLSLKKKNLKDEKIINFRFNITNNNIIGSITDLKGNVLFWKSCNSLKVTKKKQNSNILIEKLILEFLTFTFKNKIFKVNIIIKGGNKQKLNILLRPIFFSRLTILNFIDATKFPFNGCRLPKQSKLKKKKSSIIY